MNLANVYSESNDFEKAKSLIAEAQIVFSELDNPMHMNQTYVIKGDIYADHNDYEKAIDRYKFALKDADKIEGLRVQIELLGRLATTYKLVGDYKNAYAFQAELGRYQDSLQSIRNGDFIADMEAKYQTQEKEKKIGSVALIKKSLFEA